MTIDKLISRLTKLQERYGDCEVELIGETTRTGNSDDPNLPAEQQIEKTLKENNKVKVVLSRDDTLGIKLDTYSFAGWTS